MNPSTLSMSKLWLTLYEVEVVEPDEEEDNERCKENYQGVEEEVDHVEVNIGRPELRRASKPHGNHLHNFLKEFNYLSVHEEVSSEKNRSDENIKIMVGTIMSQILKSDKHVHVSVNEVIKSHGERSMSALLSEFR